GVDLEGLGRERRTVSSASVDFIRAGQEMERFHLTTCEAGSAAPDAEAPARHRACIDVDGIAVDRERVGSCAVEERFQPRMVADVSARIDRERELSSARTLPERVGACKQLDRLHLAAIQANATTTAKPELRVAELAGIDRDLHESALPAGNVADQRRLEN